MVTRLANGYTYNYSFANKPLSNKKQKSLRPHQSCAPGLPETNYLALNASRHRIPQCPKQLWRMGRAAFVALHTSEQKVTGAVLRNPKRFLGFMAQKTGFVMECETHWLPPGATDGHPQATRAGLAWKIYRRGRVLQALAKPGLLPNQQQRLQRLLESIAPPCLPEIPSPVRSSRCVPLAASGAHICRRSSFPSEPPRSFHGTATSKS
jgi:hypothetical protein